MHRLLLALPLVLPLTFAQAGEARHGHRHDQEGHASLAAHEHGSARMNLALDGQLLEIEFASPAMNLVGFEHAPRSDADKSRIAAARSSLEQPLTLFGLPGAANCQVTHQELSSALFEPAATARGHSEIQAHYQLQCAAPEALQRLDVATLFATFPATQKIQAQLIGPNGQRGVDLTAEQAVLSF